MPTIKVADLKPEGYSLLSDSESYMKDLSEDELEAGIHGGAISTPICATVVLVTYTVSIIASAAQSNPKSPHRPG
ncbi:MAG TPA: hypothetical protein DDZ80_29375 [Cyanobacteria bacterium UBA8803]|nr:hypothetical protein [Cyanobacteria bacterium UBA9273]HBL62357.1 hypothetical protein [Cyanobacteria bacterium UBA8803]